MEAAQNKVKGVILAGGMGTRLRPLTLVTNKHLLPVYDKPMILYPVETLRRAGVHDILVVTGREHAGHFMNFLGSGKEWGVRFSYAIQDKNNGGIADALSYAESFCDGAPVAVILGDNIFTDDFSRPVSAFTEGACIFIKKVGDPERYGVPVFDARKRIVRVEEKPKHAKSPFAQAGFYLMGPDVFARIKTLKPSDRGELEMTDLVNLYVKEGRLSYHVLKGAWYDAGTVDSLLDAGVSVRKSRRHV